MGLRGGLGRISRGLKMALADLSQDGATANQVVTWNGTKWAPAAGGSGPLNNFAAAVDPEPTDDSGGGYEIGSRWINTTAAPDREFVCLDATVAAAIWRPVGFYRTHGTLHSPTALYQFDRNLNNSSGAAGALTAGTGTIRYAGTANFPSAYFDGACRIDHDAYDANVSATGALTILMMIKPEVQPTASQMLASFIDYTSTEVEWRVQLVNTGEVYYVHHDGGGAGRELYSGFAVTLGDWIHVGVTRDSAGTATKIYINGWLAASTTLAGAPGAEAAARLTVGAHSNDANDYTGSIASLKIIKSELTGAQVAAEAARCGF